MSDQRDSYYYDTSYGRSSRNTPGGTPSSGFSNMGQGGRTVLPSLSSALQTSRSPVSNPYYYTQHGQQQPSQGRSDYSATVHSQGAWSSNTTPAQYQSSYSVYQQHDPRYQSQPVHSSYQSRTSPPLSVDSTNSLRLPPLNIPTGREERGPSPPYYMPTHHSSHQSTHYPSHQATHHSSHSSAATIRSPTAEYPNPYAYPTYQPTSYAHAQPPDARQLPPSVPSVNTQSRLMNPPPRISVGRGAPSRNEMHSYAPYPRNPAPPGPSGYMTEPETPTAEAAIKKKRKRADAAQLKVLNDVYQRTAFPSTEERQELAKKLDMSARSVQIWFQNKRQAMRTRQPATSSSTQHESSVSHQYSGAVMEGPISPGGYSSTPPGTSSSSRGMASAAYPSRSPEGVSFHSMGRNTPVQSSSHRRVRSPEEESDARRWSSKGY